VFKTRKIIILTTIFYPRGVEAFLIAFNMYSASRWSSRRTLGFRR